MGKFAAKFAGKKSELINKLITVLIAVLTIMCCTAPMGDLALWNGEQPDHRNQYELMTEAILDGRIYFDYGDEDELKSLKNPYNPVERKESGVTFHWDHAYYDGEYYMYFGIAPVFLAFLPFRLITGTSLTTFRATQFFTIIFIIGIFMLFKMLSKLFFKKLNLGVYLSLSAAFSIMSVWYATAEPALYCTAIIAAIALMVWSIYFFVRAVYLEEKENKQIVFAAIGSLLGASVFACRPPIGFANIVVIPLLITFLRNHKMNKKLVGKLALAASPYLLIAVGLMIYNYVRFDSPFEFGQAYQLTVTDQTSYKLSLSGDTLVRIISETIRNFFGFDGISGDFPYFETSSVLFNFPILFFTVVVLFPPVRESAKEKKIRPFMLMLFVSALVITAMDILWSPFILERYRTDIYFLMGILCFMSLGLWYEESEKKKRLTVLFSILSVATIVSAFFMYLVTVNIYYPATAREIGSSLGLC